LFIHSFSVKGIQATMHIKFLLIAGLVFSLGACAQDNDSSADAAVQSANTAAEVTEPGLGNAAAGKRLYIYCQACHTINAGGMNKVGPNLAGFMGREPGQVEGFMYSAALSDAGLTWDEATLDQWITSPSQLVPGTTMVFAGINAAKQRADLIAYLREASVAE
jgi:cytochrome c